MNRISVSLAVAGMLLCGSVAFAQSTPPSTAPNSSAPQAAPPESTGQSFRDDRLQSDRDSKVVVPAQPKNSPDPNPLPGEQPRPIPR
jgi:hypothetical protein